MQINRYSKKKSFPSWLKWSLLILILILIISTIYSIFLFKDIQESKTIGYSETEKKVLQETDIESITNITHFFDKTTYHIVFGETEHGEEKIVFVPKEKNAEKMTIIDGNEVLTKQEIRSLLENDCTKCQLIKINPAMIKDNPLWEVTYRDDTDRYVLDYLSMYDGSRYEQFKFRQTFRQTFK